MGFLVLLIKTRLVPSVTMALPGSMKSHTLASPASFISLILRANFWVLPASALLWYWGQNLGPWTCLARTLSLGYSPSPDLFHLSSKRKSLAFSSDKDLLLPGYDRLSSRQCCYFSLALKIFSSSVQQLQSHLESTTTSPHPLPELFCCLSSNWKDMFAVPKMERYITRVVEQRYFTPFPNSPSTDSKQTHAQKCAQVHSAVTT